MFWCYALMLPGFWYCWILVYVFVFCFVGGGESFLGVLLGLLVLILLWFSDLLGFGLLLDS